MFITLADYLECAEDYEAELSAGIDCANCGKHIVDGGWLYFNHGFSDDDICEDCGKQFIGEEEKAAEDWAKQNCKLTSTLEVFDPSERFAPTPEEYENGNRYAYTQNAVHAGNRHSATNYEQCLKELGLSKFDDDDRSGIWYHAIRNQCDELCNNE